MASGEQPTAELADRADSGELGRAVIRGLVVAAEADEPAEADASRGIPSAAGSDSPKHF